MSERGARPQPWVMPPQYARALLRQGGADLRRLRKRLPIRATVAPAQQAGIALAPDHRVAGDDGVTPLRPNRSGQLAGPTHAGFRPRTKAPRIRPETSRARVSASSPASAS